MKRKRDIDQNLREELKKKMRSFWKKGMPAEENDEEEAFEAIMKLGRFSYLARFATEEMLDGITSHSKTAFKNLALCLYFLFFTIMVGVNYDLTKWESWLGLSVFVFPTLVFLYWAIRSLKKHHSIRETYIRLVENPTLSFCDEVYEELVERDYL